MSKKTEKKVVDENFDTDDNEKVNEESATKENEDLEAEAKDMSDDKEDEKEAKDDSKEEVESKDESSKEDKKSSKKDKKNKTKDKTKEIIDELNDKVMRQMAEFENFRKRSEKEKNQMYDMGAKSTLEKILPVVDNFERGLESAPEDDPFVDGMKMIYKQFITSLEEAGVKEIEAVGVEFDPEYHNAVMHIEDEELGENVVAEVLQKGYMYNDSVLRHAMVKVAN